MPSKYFAVSWDASNKAWSAKTTHPKRDGGDGKKKHLGYYDDERSAALAVDAFVRERMPGLTAKLNFPDMDPRDLAQELAQAKERRQRRYRTAMRSDYRGVCWDDRHKAWKAQMKYSLAHGGDGKNHHLGHYDDERSAALAVDAYVRERMPGQTARLNFPDMDPRDLARELAQVKPRGRGGAMMCRACGQPRKGHVCPFKRGTKREAEVPPSTDPEATIAAPVEGPPKKKRGLPEGARAVSGEGRAESEATVAAQRKPAAKRPRTRPTPKPAEESRRPEKKTPTPHTEAVDGHLVFASAVPL